MTVLAAPALVAHGYTYGQIDQLARYAVRRHRPGRIAGFDEYLDIAIAAIHDRLLEAVEPPDETDLLRAAGRGIYAFAYEWEQAHGWDHKALSGRPAFVKFWTTWHPPLPEEAVVDALAVRQIWPMLTPAQRDALVQLARHNYSSRAAADAMGLRYNTFNMRIRDARERFQALWYAPETPPRRVWRVTFRVPPEKRRKYDPVALRRMQAKGRCRRHHGPDCTCWEDAAASCSHQGCSDPPEKRGLCLTHYRRLARGS